MSAKKMDLPVIHVNYTQLTRLRSKGICAKLYVTASIEHIRREVGQLVTLQTASGKEATAIVVLKQRETVRGLPDDDCIILVFMAVDV